jgi:antitoxin CptB
MAWRCRRGMKELDLLLSGWLETQFERASEAQRGQFEALLELPDPQLARYLLGGERPEGPNWPRWSTSILTGNALCRPRAGREPSLTPTLQTSLVPAGTADRS